MSHLHLMMITNLPDIAAAAEASGVDRIFLDFERLGKWERQGHLDTYISDHQFEDIAAVRAAVSRAQVLARVNPFNVRSPYEIDEVIRGGADVVMLPMFTSRKQVSRFVELVGGRARTCLLLETPQAMIRVRDIVREPGIDEIHIGLNDLHLGLGLDFMFEIMTSGVLDFLSDTIRSRGIRFGFGGIARVGEGLLPAEKILTEHARLRSEMVILSRTFHRRARTLVELKQNVNLDEEVSKIQAVYALALNRSQDEIERDRHEVEDLVMRIVSRVKD